MINNYITLGYAIINLSLAGRLLLVNRRNYLHMFYGICVLALSCLGLTGYLLGSSLPGVVMWWMEKANQFLFSLFPFLFLHFMLVFVKRYRLLTQKYNYAAIYLTGLFTYAMVLLNFIPVPFSREVGITPTGYVYYVIWESLLFSIGIAMLYSRSGGVAEGGIRPSALFVGLAFLMLLLPSPFTLVIFGDNYGWFIFASIMALAIAVYALVRNSAASQMPSKVMNAALAAMNNFLIKTDTEFRIQTVQGALGSILGYSDKELIGQPLAMLIEQREYLGSYRDFTVSGKMVEGTFDAELICRNGARIPMSLFLAPIFSSGEIAGYVAVMRERLKGERTDESTGVGSTSFQALFEANPTPMWVYDLDTLNFVVVNDAAVQYYGYSHSEFLAMDLGNICTADTIHQALEGWHDDSIPVRRSTMMKHRKGDGSVIDVEVLSQDLPFGGRPARLEIITDITDRKLAERAIAHQLSSQEFARNIINSSTDMIIAVDMQRRITEFNRAAQKTFGYDLDDVLGKPVDMLYAEPEAGLPVYKSVVEKGYIVCMVQNRRKNGEIFQSHLSASAIRDDRGNLIGLMGVSHDATFRKELDRVKSEFISVVSHELRTPLTSIVASLGLIEEEAREVFPLHLVKMIAIASENSQRLMSLVNDILDMEKLDSANMQFHVTTTGLCPIVQRAVEDITPWAMRMDVSIDLDLREIDALVEVDPDRLHQVVTNLLSNAIKFSPPHDKVCVALSRINHSALIEVTDHGPGIPKDFEERVFEKFARADTPATRKKAGTGLGLRISKEIVERLGGKIGFHSQPGIRTTFFVQLPARN